jgi:hypothetical protein
MQDDGTTISHIKYSGMHANRGSDSKNKAEEINVILEYGAATISMRFVDVNQGKLVDGVQALLSDRKEEIKFNHPGSSTTVKITVPPAEVPAVLTALTKEKQVDRNTTVYPVLAARDVGQIIDHLGQTIGLSQEQMKMWSPKVVDIPEPRRKLMGLKEPFSYMDKSEITHPDSQVLSVREQMFTCHPRPYVYTELEIKGDTAAAVKRFEDQGVQADEFLKAPGFIKVEAPASQVMALAGDLLPRALADEIGQRSEALHPNQAEHNKPEAGVVPTSTRIGPRRVVEEGQITK